VIDDRVDRDRRLVSTGPALVAPAMIGDPVWGPSFERVYLALTLAFVAPLDVMPAGGVGQIWICESCGCMWGGHSLAPTAHACECPLHLSEALTRELGTGVASRQPRTLAAILDQFE
jgi:hypothetical protein